MFVRNDTNILPKSPEEFVKNGAYQDALKNFENWRSIPLLNYTQLHKLKDYSVVRFRGMVQDMQDPEIYLERYEVKTASGQTRMQEGKYRDCLHLKSDEQVNYDADCNVHGERRTLFVVSIPGLNDWSKEYEQQCNEHNEQSLLTQASENNDDVSSGNVVKKRSAPSDDNEMEVDVPPTSTRTNSGGDGNKRQCVESENVVETNENKSQLLGSEYLLNSPLPERPSMACMIKIYKDFDSHTLNSLVDVIGFLSVDPSLDASTMDEDMCKDFDNVSELQAQNPPPSLIPRLHAIAIRPLYHANPLLDESLHVLPQQTAPDNLNMISLQKDLRMLLTLCLFNDDLAAEYLLSHLMSTVYSRSEMQSIGKFALNICNFPKDISNEYTEKLYEIISLLVPASHYLPLTLETMNNSSFVPKKDYETNKLVSGLLQLAPHTHLVLDETRMQQGKLESNGIMGIQQLATLINEQQIKCNFQFYDIDYNSDIPVLVLSEGRSMLPNDFSLPLNVDTESVKLMDETLKAAHHYLQPARLDQFRRYLTKARICSFSMNPEDSEMIQNDFVEMRKTNPKSNVDDLHALLVLSRLLAISRGKEVLDRESWDLAKDLESKRKQRVQELPKSKLSTMN